jgi:hypothetical protein
LGKNDCPDVHPHPRLPRGCGKNRLRADVGVLADASTRPHGRGPAWTRASADLARTGTWGSWGSKTEHFFLSFPVANNQKNKKKLFFYFFIFFRASARTQQPIRARRVRGYRGKRAREGEGRERSSSVRTRLCPCGREPFCPQVTS